jgi:AraC family transcriptional regulator of adaptative response / DNA-3-methyladenine glycosylase II
LFDLDADPVAVDEALASDARLCPSVRDTPGIRVPGAVDPQELLIRAMIGQQITVAAARTALSQLSDAGTRLPEGHPGHALGLDRLFPTAGEIARSGRELLKGPQRRIDSVLAAAAAMASGELDFDYGDDPQTLADKLLPLPGVGPWTVGYVAMRVIGDPDVFLANDAAVRNGLKNLAASEGLPTDFRNVSPWRSYATMHLWRAAASKRGSAIVSRERSMATGEAPASQHRPRRQRPAGSPG